MTTRPEKMSGAEREMLDNLRGDATLLLKQYAVNGYIDMGDGPEWISHAGQDFALRRCHQIADESKWWRKHGMPVAGPRYIRGRQSPDANTYDWGSNVDD